MKETIINIKLVDIPIFLGSNREQILNGSEFDNRRKGLHIINTLLLSVSPNNKSSLIPFNGSIRFLFNLIDAFTRIGFLLGREGQYPKCGLYPKLEILLAWTPAK